MRKKLRARTGARVRAVGLSFALTAALVSLSASSASAAGTTSCSSSNASCTVTFTSPSSPTDNTQTWTVPTAVNSIGVTLYGANGGKSYQSVAGGGIAGGNGAEVTANIAVNPGQTLETDTGGGGVSGNCSGFPSGGVNGGGDGAVVYGCGSGGGGGASDISDPSAGVLLVVAGGGGGGSYNGLALFSCTAWSGSGVGGNADAPGNDGATMTSSSGSVGGGGGGQAGTASAPGAGGAAGSISTGCGGDTSFLVQGAAGGAGSAHSGLTVGQGGVGAAAVHSTESWNAYSEGGGGGGGYSGGGGGGSGAADNATQDAGGAGGGGGGASWGGAAGVTAFATVAGYTGNANGSNGEIVISYDRQASTTALTASLGSPVFGQPDQLTATITAGGSPVTDGSVQFEVNGADAGAPVAVDGSGTATYTVPGGGLPVGADTVTAVWSGDYVAAGSSGQKTLNISQASTATAVTATATQLSATVSPVAPGAGTPSGTVVFKLNGTVVGSAPLGGSGVATLNYASTGARTITASYSGDTSFAASLGSLSVTDPTISATVTGSGAESASGWYTGPVTVSFTCTPGSAALTASCPSPVTLDQNGAAQTVTRTIAAADGGTATVTTTVINIDLTTPVISFSGVTDGGSYPSAAPPQISCTAKDSVSGVAGACTVTVSQSGSTVTYTGTATSVAGTVGTASGTYTLTSPTPTTVTTVTTVTTPPKHRTKPAHKRKPKPKPKPVPRPSAFPVIVVRGNDTHASVRIGKTYEIEIKVDSRTAPTYLWAAPTGTPLLSHGTRMKRAGNDSWTVRIQITRAMRHFRHWTIGVRTGRVTRLVRLTLS